MGAPASPSASLQLDVFRGLAAVFMVSNHAGYQLLGPAAAMPGWPGLLVFIVSSAPALFFFASGVGAGMSRAAPESAGGVLRKVALLMLADAFMTWRGGGNWGFDFFGFAAVTVLVLALVRWTRRPGLVAAALLLAVVAVRFVVGPMLRGDFEGEPAFSFIAGVGTLPGLSYPLSPWLAFPLAGFLLGRHGNAMRPGTRVLLTFAIAAATGLAALALALHGAVVFRWGAVSLAYFLFAVAVIGFAWLAAAGLVAGWRPAATALRLRGAASLLIVPLHFSLLPILALAWPSPWPAAAWLFAVAALCAVVLALARAIVTGLGPRVPVLGREGDLLAILAVAGVAATARLWTAGLLRLEIECAAQVAIGLLLLARRGPAVRAPRSNDLAFERREQEVSR